MSLSTTGEKCLQECGGAVVYVSMAEGRSAIMRVQEESVYEHMEKHLQGGMEAVL
jgi:hypothetical protein